MDYNHLAYSMGAEYADYLLDHNLIDADPQKLLLYYLHRGDPLPLEDYQTLTRAAKGITGEIEEHYKQGFNAELSFRFRNLEATNQQ